MYEAIVFMPLLGALLPASSPLLGARNRLPGEDPPPPHHDNGAPLVPEQLHAATRPDTAHAELAYSAADEHETTEPAAGSRAAELVTTTFFAFRGAVVVRV